MELDNCLMIRMVSKQSSISHTVWPTHLKTKKNQQCYCAGEAFAAAPTSLIEKQCSSTKIFLLRRFSEFEAGCVLTALSAHSLITSHYCPPFYISTHCVHTSTQLHTHICIFDVITNMNSFTQIYLCIISGTKYCFACTLCRSTISVRHSKSYIENFSFIKIWKIQLMFN